MGKSILWIAAIIISSGLTAGAATDAETKATPKAKSQSTCPVMGGSINKKYFAEHEGKRVYFCCPGCDAPFKKDPAAYVKKLEDSGVTLEKVQTACPVMGGAIDKNFYLDHEGQRIYFCCGMCPDTFKADPAKYLKVLYEQGVTPEPVAPKAEEPNAKK